MVPDASRLLALGCVCILLTVSGCGGVSPGGSSPPDVSPTESATESPTAATTPENQTGTPENETSAPEGLLIVDVVENQSELNSSEVVRYNRTVFNDAPTLDDAVTDAISANSTQTRDLSSQEVRQVESVADAYDEPTGDFAVSKNGTVVRISLAYEA